MFFVDPRIKEWANSLAFMTETFRSDYVGLEKNEAMARVKKVWSGSEVAEIDENVFAVRHQMRLEPFVFHFLASQDNDKIVQGVVVEAKPPFENVLLVVDGSLSAYTYRDSQVKLSKKEKELCKLLDKYGIKNVEKIYGACK